MKAVILLLFLVNIFAMGAFADDGSPENILKNLKRKNASARKERLDEILDKEFKVLKKVNEIRKGRDPKILYRLLELYSEKIKLVKEQENTAFLKSGSTKDPKTAFVESKKLYLEALELGKLLLKRFPRYSGKADIYYALALNSRDFESGRITETYLHKAIKFGKTYKKSALLHNAYASLADFYYNEKKFKWAIPYYRRVIKNENDDWNTKYTFNLSWCYLKAKKHNKAIDTMKSAFFKSKNPKFINISDQVLSHIGLFYALGKRVNDGIQFYISHTDVPVPYLIKMANLLKQRGLFNLANSTLNQALALSTTNELRLDVFDAKMGLFAESKDIEKHFKASQNYFRLVQKAEEKYLNDLRKEDMTIRLTNFVSFIQKGFTNKTLRLSKTMEKKFSQIVIKYFEMLSFFDVINSSKYNYYIAETHYSVGSKINALEVYQRSFNLAVEEKKELEVKIKTLNSMLAILAEIDPRTKLGKETNSKFLIWTYEAYIITEPTSKTSQGIFPKLFAAYFQEENLNKAKDVVYQYQKVFPTDIELQKELFTQILDNKIQNNNPEELNSWIKEAANSPLAFSKDYLSKAEQSLGKLLFDQNRSLVKKGKTPEAFKGYEDLFNKENYPINVRFNSGFNLAKLYLKRVDPLNAKEWYEKTLSLYTSSTQKTEKVVEANGNKLTEKNRESLVPLAAKISEQMFMTGAHKDGKKHAAKELVRICKYENKFKAEKSLNFQYALQLSLASGNLETAKRILSLADKCEISSSDRAFYLESIYEESLRENEIDEFITYVSKNNLEFSFDRILSRSYNLFLRSQVSRSDLEELVNNHNGIFSENLKGSIQNYFEVQKIAESIELKELNLSNFRSKNYVEENEGKTTFLVEKFGTEFNSALQNRIKTAQGFIEMLSPIVKAGYAESGVRAYEIMEQIYRELAGSIENVEIDQAPKEFKQSFFASMNGLRKQFLAKAREFKNLRQRNQRNKNHRVHAVSNRAEVSKVNLVVADV